MRRRFTTDEFEREQTDSAAVWMISFSDLLTVLLAMFVMRFSMSTFNPETLKKVLPSKEIKEQPEVVPTISPSAALVETLRPLADAAPTSTEAVPTQLDDRIVVEEMTSGALLSLGGDTFQPGSRELSPSAMGRIQAIASVLHNSAGHFEIAGHSDDIPIHTALYPSNWELSAARAIEVALVLMRSGIPGERISAVGYAETKPRAANDTPEGRQKNRRVEIMIKLDASVAPMENPEKGLS